MKTVTATAALDTGRYQPNSQVSGKNGKIISGTPLRNFGGEDFGNVDLTFALTHSINTVWAEVGVKLGRSTLAGYMSRFGFGSKPPMDFPPDQMSTSGPYRKGKVISETSRFVDVGRTAIGQALLLVTPLQMASVAQTIGNGGLRMEPRLVKQVVDPDGRTVDEPTPKEAERVMSTETAAKLTAMMKQVVKEGTGTAAALEGVEVAGKTGTAELDINAGINDLWFIGFTPKVAVAVVLDHLKGQGGTVAAPVAKQVLQALGSMSVARDTIVDGRYRVAVAPRRGRHGRGLERRGLPARPPRRAQAARLALRRRSRLPRALPPRGGRRRRDAAPEHRRRSTTAASGTARRTSRWSWSTGRRSSSWSGSAARPARARPRT